ncbi:MAG: hypothetical protein ACKO0Z_09235 [Betaproteobacteria bacterium]
MKIIKREGGKLACGSLRPSGARKFNVAFDDETYQKVIELATAGKVSFAEQVRVLVEWGIEAEKEYR